MAIYVEGPDACVLVYLSSAVDTRRLTSVTSPGTFVADVRTMLSQSYWLNLLTFGLLQDICREWCRRASASKAERQLMLIKRASQAKHQLQASLCLTASSHVLYCRLVLRKRRRTGVCPTACIDHWQMGFCLLEQDYSPSHPSR